MKNGILKFAIMLAVIAIGFAASAESAWAQGASFCPGSSKLYVYTGVGFTSTSGDTDLVSAPSGLNGYVCMNYCSGTFAIFPAAFSFSDGVHTITDKNWVASYGNSAPFQFTCDAQGNITQWGVGLQAYPNSPLSRDLVIDMGTANWGPTKMDYSAFSWSNSCPVINGSCQGGFYAYNNVGTWTGSASCDTVLQNSVSRTTDGSVITATFTPNGGSIALAANLCGVDHFNWQQTINYLPNPNTWLALGPQPEHILTAPPKFFDPPPVGLVDPARHNIVCRGITWVVGAMAPDDSYPFYYDAAELLQYTTGATLSFYDDPNDACLSGNDPSGNPGAHVEFTTTLVGAGAAGYPINLSIVNTWDWLSTSNHTSGGAHILKNLNPPDPGSGTGGVAVTSVNGISTRGTCAADVTANVHVVLGGYAYSMATGRFSQKATLTNTSGAAIAGPLSLVLDGLPTGVSLYSATGATNCAAPIGSPFITINGDLAAGASVAVTLQLPDPTMTPITYKPRVLAGTATR
jgi:hypothetical protein